MKIIYDPLELNLDPKKENTLLELCLKRKVPIGHSCEGMASCGTCRVIITKGQENLPPRNELETEMAVDRNFKDNERLACQLSPTHNFNFILPEDL